MVADRRAGGGPGQLSIPGYRGEEQALCGVFGAAKEREVQDANLPVDGSRFVDRVSLRDEDEDEAEAGGTVAEEPAQETRELVTRGGRVQESGACNKHERSASLREASRQMLTMECTVVVDVGLCSSVAEELSRSSC